MMQEILLGGHLYQIVLKDRIQNWLENMKYCVIKIVEKDVGELNQLKMQQATKYSFKLERSMQNFLSTGNLVSKSGLGLMQNSGLVIMAENINRMRYMSHFR